MQKFEVLNARMELFNRVQSQERLTKTQVRMLGIVEQPPVLCSCACELCVCMYVCMCVCCFS